MLADIASGAFTHTLEGHRSVRACVACLAHVCEASAAEQQGIGHAVMVCRSWRDFATIVLMSPVHLQPQLCDAHMHLCSSVSLTAKKQTCGWPQATSSLLLCCAASCAGLQEWHLEHLLGPEQRIPAVLWGWQWRSAALGHSSGGLQGPARLQQHTASQTHHGACQHTMQPSASGPQAGSKWGAGRGGWVWRWQRAKSNRRSSGARGCSDWGPCYTRRAQLGVSRDGPQGAPVGCR